MYDLYLFDLDGTLTDNSAGIKNSMHYAINALGIENKIEDIAPLIGPGLHENFREHFGLAGERLEFAVEKYREHFSKIGIFENEVYPGIPETLAALKERGVKTAIATSKLTECAEIIANHFDFAKYFDYICGSCPNGDRSAKKEIIEDVLRFFGKTRAVMIGDRKYDIIGANKTGIESIGVLWGFGSRAELEQAGATYIISTPDEILKKF